MSDRPALRITGEVARPGELTYDDLAAMPADAQILDVRRIDPKRRGDAVKLSELLRRAGVLPSARYLGLHSQVDDFHASIPLAPVLERAFVIYRLDGEPLTASQGGPFRFFIPDFAACHTHEIDECANVKFVEHMELTSAMGIDNRPHDGAEHEQLHQRQSASQ
jgi:DMSO/TMAO reductase YedYZ molybdopterin-dependent catalytic subunit